MTPPQKKPICVDLKITPIRVLYIDPDLTKTHHMDFRNTFK